MPKAPVPHLFPPNDVHAYAAPILAGQWGARYAGMAFKCAECSRAMPHSEREPKADVAAG
jgi:hypothetical protein